MKKVLVAILAFIYLGTATGATVHLHYCMGKLVGWSLWHNTHNKCSKCGMDKSAKKNGCCKDEHKQLKLDKDQKLSESFFKIIQFTAVAHSSFIELPDVPLFSIAEENPVSNAPPESKRVAIYIRNCVFRI